MKNVENIQKVICEMTKMERTALFYWLRENLKQNMTAEEQKDQALFESVTEEVFRKNEEVLKELAK